RGVFTDTNMSKENLTMTLSSWNKVDLLNLFWEKK
ncbi:MAG: hypothetical protein ACI86M_003377, partial [Saprospiraceae bacterium]